MDFMCSHCNGEVSTTKAIVAATTNSLLGTTIPKKLVMPLLPCRLWCPIWWGPTPWLLQGKCWWLPEVGRPQPLLRKTFPATSLSTWRNLEFAIPHIQKIAHTHGGRKEQFIWQNTMTRCLACVRGRGNRQKGQGAQASRD